MEKLQDILETSRVNPRASFYSGRGATVADLTSDILIKIQGKIKKEYGKVAEKAFVSMVIRMKVLSATAFINNLYKLHNSNWVLPERDVEESNYDVSTRGAAFATAFHAISSTIGDDTTLIRSGFMRHNKIMPLYMNRMGQRVYR